MTTENDQHILAATTSIVCAAISANRLAAEGVADFIKEVGAALRSADTGNAAPAAQKVPAIDPRKSVHDDYIVCLEDGKKFKSLKRHLSSHFGLTPDEYRAKWGLPATYPMAAPNYAAARSELAKKMGLGRKPAPVRKAA